MKNSLKEKMQPKTDYAETKVWKSFFFQVVL